MGNIGVLIAVKHARLLLLLIDRCPLDYTYNPYSDMCYRLSRKIETWINAQKECQKKGESLIVLDTIQDINFFRTLLLQDPGMNLKIL